MQNLIVLGLVPGTNFQITFAALMYAALGFSGLLALRYAWRHRLSLHILLASVHIALIIDRGQVRA